MRWLPDQVVDHLRDAADWPDLDGTKYEVLERIGRGGMGTVYRAHDRELGRDVALKVMRAPETDAAAVARMAREARTLARLEHPAIVPVHDVGTLPDGRVFYVMKLVRGTRLDEYARDPRPLPELLRAFERVCEAVAFAHANGVIHRDLKPENVMVGPWGEALVMDWGVAKVRDVSDEVTPAQAGAQESMPAGARGAGSREAGGNRVRGNDGTGRTASGTVMGTPGYMAPEQAAGAVDEIDARTDVYALGAMLYFLLTRAAPAVSAAEVAPPRRLDPTIPRALEAVVTMAMHPEPARRYAGADALAADVRAFAAGRPVAAYREGVLERARRLARVYRTPILLVLAYLLMRVLLLAFG